MVFDKELMQYKDYEKTPLHISITFFQRDQSPPFMYQLDHVTR